MYLTFYGLKEKPFATMPDPRFLYLTPGHREALSHLLYGVQDKMGFLVLTGEVGTGKTTLLQSLRQHLDGKSPVAFMVNSGLSFDGLLEYMLEDLGVPNAAESRAQRLLALQRFLMERDRAGENVVLIFDEAHHLAPETLEHIRLLSNFESPTQKFLQILLVGQPELKVKLALPELRQLKQRIALRAVIPALSPQETREYIRRRLSIAGARDLGLFTERAVSRIAAYAHGIPRTVNIVCNHCLLVGYADQRRRVDVDIVKQAVRYLEDGAQPDHALAVIRRPAWWRRLAAAEPDASLDEALPTVERTVKMERPIGATAVTRVVPLEHSSPATSRDRGRRRQRAFLIGAVTVAVGGLVLTGAVARHVVRQRATSQNASVVPFTQPKALEAPAVSPGESPQPTPTVAPVAPVAPAGQPEDQRATVRAPSPPEAQTAPVDLPSPPAPETATAVLPTQPSAENKPVKNAVPRTAAVPVPKSSSPKRVGDDGETVKNPVPRTPVVPAAKPNPPTQASDDGETVKNPVPRTLAVPAPKPTSPKQASDDGETKGQRLSADPAPIRRFLKSLSPGDLGGGVK